MNQQTFKKPDRLNGATEYKAVFAGAKKSSDGIFTVLAKKNTILSPRLGLAITKKKVRKAAKRNSVKRVIRESFRKQKHVLMSYDFVVLCGNNASEASKQDLAASIRTHWEKLATNE